MSTLDFRGDGPFDLPKASEIAVTTRGRAVLLSFSVPLNPTRQVVVRIAVSSNQAGKLVAEIQHAASRIAATRKQQASGERT